jgi:type VI secretion system protein ImpJ
MKRLQPVIWAKGTFLTPQHLQMQDRYLENSLQFQLDALSFRPWGFRELTLNQEALAGGNFAIHSASGIMPDGLPFEIPGADPAPAPKPILPYFDQDQETLDVYLAIPHHREQALNVSVAQQRNADTRYLAEIVNLRDENTGLAERPIQVAKKNFRLLVEGESLEGSTHLRVARVRRTPAGMLQIDDAIVPPLLDIGANERLMAMVKRLVEILGAKSSILSGTRRQRSASLADFTQADIGNFWLLFTVNNYFPVLRHIHEVRRGHPEFLFHTLTSLAGVLTTFSMKIQPRDLPLYDHVELGDCFGNIYEKLLELLETVIPSNCVSLPLKLAQQSIYATPIDDDKYLVGTRMYLSVSSDMPAGELMKKVPQLVKVCSASQIDALVKQALPGIQLTHAPSPPSSIPIKLNCQYFSLNQSGAAWETVGRARNLAAYVPNDIPNPNLELIILLPQAK